MDAPRGVAAGPVRSAGRAPARTTWPAGGLGADEVGVEEPQQSSVSGSRRHRALESWPRRPCGVISAPRTSHGCPLGTPTDRAARDVQASYPASAWSTLPAMSAVRRSASPRRQHRPQSAQATCSCTGSTQVPSRPRRRRAVAPAPVAGRPPAVGGLPVKSTPACAGRDRLERLVHGQQVEPEPWPAASGCAEVRIEGGEEVLRIENSAHETGRAASGRALGRTRAWPPRRSDRR